MGKRKKDGGTHNVWLGCKYLYEREREKARETERERDGEMDRETSKDTDRQGVSLNEMKGSFSPILSYPILVFSPSLSLRCLYSTLLFLHACMHVSECGQKERKRGGNSRRRAGCSCGKFIYHQEIE